MYTNTSLIEQQLQRSLTDEEKGLLTTLIPAVDLWIDRTLNTTFIEKEAVETRYFDGRGPLIEIDPCTGVTAISAVDWQDTSVADYTTGVDYLLEPVNSNVKNLVRFGGGYGYPWVDQSIMPVADRTNNRLAVTAKFSEYDDGVPEDIQIVATRICGGLIGESYSNQANDTNLKSESIEGYSVTFGESVNQDAGQLAMNDPIVKGILESRRELLT